MKKLRLLRSSILLREVLASLPVVPRLIKYIMSLYTIRRRPEYLYDRFV